MTESTIPAEAAAKDAAAKAAGFYAEDAIVHSRE